MLIALYPDDLEPGDVGIAALARLLQVPGHEADPREGLAGSVNRSDARRPRAVEDEGDIPGEIPGRAPRCDSPCSK